MDLISRLSVPPSVGTLGALLFFLALFSLSSPDRAGYEQFRDGGHRSCPNGILHAVGMPLAVSGVFLLVRAASDGAAFTRHLQLCVTSAYLCLYLRFEPAAVGPAVFWLSYMAIFEGVLHRCLYTRRKLTRAWYFWTGVALIALNVGMLETIGHGLIEGHHSHALEFFNNVFHTPLYGVNSVLLSVGLVAPRPDHTCW